VARTVLRDMTQERSRFSRNAWDRWLREEVEVRFKRLIQRLGFFNDFEGRGLKVASRSRGGGLQIRRKGGRDERVIDGGRGDFRRQNL